MRLVRYQHGLGVHACRECDNESVLLDCHLCERRAVRKLGPNEAGNEVWACYNCRVPKIKCPQCARGWVESHSEQCDYCEAEFPDTKKLGDFIAV